MNLSKSGSRDFFKEIPTHDQRIILPQIISTDIKTSLRPIDPTEYKELRKVVKNPK